MRPLTRSVETKEVGPFLGMPLRILIADDSEMIRRGIRSILSEHADFCVCGEAGDGAQAIEMSRELRPDVILLDLSMSPMGGAEACRVIRQDGAPTAIILITENDPEIIRRQAVELDASAFVSKSALFEDLVPAIRAAVGNRAADGSVDSIQTGMTDPKQSDMALSPDRGRQATVTRLPEEQTPDNIPAADREQAPL